MEWLTPILSKVDNLAVLTLILCLLGLGWLYYTERKENRADRQQLMDLHLRLVEAINEVKVAIAVLTGKSP
jgi:hypothetical protein